MQRWKILARHHWVVGAVITESCRVGDEGYRRFTATIRGSRNWKIWQGRTPPAERIMRRVQEIRDRIDAGDESVWTEDNTVT